MLDSFLWRYVLDEDARRAEDIDKLIEEMNKHYDNYQLQEEIYISFVEKGIHLTESEKKKISSKTGFTIN